MSNDEQNEAPRFAETFCSQCGEAFGPGDSGFSHCDQHSNLLGLNAVSMAEIEAVARAICGPNCDTPKCSCQPNSNSAGQCWEHSKMHARAAITTLDLHRSALSDTTRGK